MDLSAKPTALQQRRVLDETVRQMARYYGALKDTVRLRILATLAHSDNEMTVTELARALSISQPLVSFHLQPLRTQGLVTVRRSGRVVYCALNLAEVERRHEELMQLLSSRETQDSNETIGR